MKAIVLNAILSSFRSRKDKSMGFSVSTPELDVPQKIAMMELEGINVRMLIEPTDYVPEAKVEVGKEVHAKTNSERLRAVIFVKFKQSDTKDDFDTYYKSEMNRLIEFVKSELQPTPF